MSDYELAADADLKAAEVSDTDLLRVGNELQILRTMPSGYYSAEIDEGGWDLGFGLSQQGALRQAARALCSVPLVASGGAGEPAHFARVFNEADVDGALAASVFHSGQIAIPELKRYLRAQGIEVRDGR